MRRQPFEREFQDRFGGARRPAEAALRLVQPARHAHGLEQEIAEARPRRVEGIEAAPPRIDRRHAAPFRRALCAPRPLDRRREVLRQTRPQLRQFEVVLQPARRLALLRRQEGRAVYGRKALEEIERARSALDARSTGLAFDFAVLGAEGRLRRLRHPPQPGGARLAQAQPPVTLGSNPAPRREGRNDHDVNGKPGTPADRARHDIARPVPLQPALFQMTQDAPPFPLNGALVRLFGILTHRALLTFPDRSSVVR